MPAKRKEYCKRGLHKMTDDNVYVPPNQNSRKCKACKRMVRRKHHEANLEKYNKMSREYNKRNRDKIQARNNQRYKEDINYRLAVVLRSRLNVAIRNGQKVGSAVEDLGCSIEEFKLYIENQFQEGMTWDNWGDWHLDHVIPLSSFNLDDEMEYLEAVNWLNYQPLWALENYSKGAGIQ